MELLKPMLDLLLPGLPRPFHLISEGQVFLMLAGTGSGGRSTTWQFGIKFWPPTRLLCSLHVQSHHWVRLAPNWGSKSLSLLGPQKARLVSAGRVGQISSMIFCLIRTFRWPERTGLRSLGHRIFEGMPRESALFPSLHLSRVLVIWRSERNHCRLFSKMILRPTRDGWLL